MGCTLDFLSYNYNSDTPSVQSDGELTVEFAEMERYASLAATSNTVNDYWCVLATRPELFCLDIAGPSTLSNSLNTTAFDLLSDTVFSNGEFILDIYKNVDNSSLNLFGQYDQCDGKVVGDGLINVFDIATIIAYIFKDYKYAELDANPEQVVTVQGRDRLQLQCDQPVTRAEYLSSYATDTCVYFDDGCHGNLRWANAGCGNSTGTVIHLYGEDLSSQTKREICATACEHRNCVNFEIRTTRCMTYMAECTEGTSTGLLQEVYEATYSCQHDYLPTPPPPSPYPPMPPESPPSPPSIPSPPSPVVASPCYSATQAQTHDPNTCVGNELTETLSDIGSGSYTYIVSYTFPNAPVGWENGQIFQTGSRDGNGMLGLWILPGSSSFNEFWFYNSDFTAQSTCQLSGNCSIPHSGQLVVRYNGTMRTLEAYESSTGSLLGRYTTPDTRADPISPTTFCLGGETGGYGGAFDGDITAFQLFPSALTDAEVSTYRTACSSARRLSYDTSSQYLPSLTHQPLTAQTLWSRWQSAPLLTPQDAPMTTRSWLPVVAARHDVTRVPTRQLALAHHSLYPDYDYANGRWYTLRTASVSLRLHAVLTGIPGGQRTTKLSYRVYDGSPPDDPTQQEIRYTRFCEFGQCDSTCASIETAHPSRVAMQYNTLELVQRPIEHACPFETHIWVPYQSISDDRCVGVEYLIIGDGVRGQFARDTACTRHLLSPPPPTPLYEHPHPPPPPSRLPPTPIVSYVPPPPPNASLLLPPPPSVNPPSTDESWVWVVSITMVVLGCGCCCVALARMRSREYDNSDKTDDITIVTPRGEMVPIVVRAQGLGSANPNPITPRSNGHMTERRDVEQQTVLPPPIQQNRHNDTNSSAVRDDTGLAPRRIPRLSSETSIPPHDATVAPAPIETNRYPTTILRDSEGSGLAPRRISKPLYTSIPPNDASVTPVVIEKNKYSTPIPRDSGGSGLAPRHIPKALPVAYATVQVNRHNTLSSQSSRDGTGLGRRRPLPPPIGKSRITRQNANVSDVVHDDEFKEDDNVLRI